MCLCVFCVFSSFKILICLGYLLIFCLFSKERERKKPWSWVGKEMEGSGRDGEGETIIKIYYMEKNLFSI